MLQRRGQCLSPLPRGRWRALATDQSTPPSSLSSGAQEGCGGRLLGRKSADWRFRDAISMPDNSALVVRPFSLGKSGTFAHFSAAHFCCGHACARGPVVQCADPSPERGASPAAFGRVGTPARRLHITTPRQPNGTHKPMPRAAPPRTTAHLDSRLLEDQ